MGEQVGNKAIDSMEDHGMYVDRIESSMFENSLVVRCWMGFRLEDCVDCQFLNNTIKQNDRGICASRITDCRLTNNTLYNYEFNICLDQDSSDNAFYWNTASGEREYLA